MSEFANLKRSTVVTRAGPHHDSVEKSKRLTPTQGGHAHAVSGVEQQVRLPRLRARVGVLLPAPMQPPRRPMGSSLHFVGSASNLGLRVTLGVLGAASFGAGIFGVFVSDNGTGTGVLIAFGGVVSVLALLGDRIESLEFGGGKLKLRAEAARRFELAEESERMGESGEAERLRGEARALLDAARPVASEYRSTREAMHAGPERTRALEKVVRRARRLAGEESFSSGEVARWLREGSDEQRITALAMMQANPSLRDFEAALGAIENSHSGFEQYHAMLLALQMIDDLDDAQRQQLVEGIKGVRNWRFRRDSDRWLLSEEILRRTG